MQRACFSGHKMMNCLNYQRLSVPEELIFALHGPIEGRHHDLTILTNSGWGTGLQGSLSSAGRQFYIYEDQAHLLWPTMMRPFTGNLYETQEIFKLRMRASRVSVEHNDNDLKQCWVSQDFSRNLKVREAPIGMCTTSESR